MCRTFSEMGVDILKLPFPLDHTQSQDKKEWQDACDAVNEACTIPWALLSAGVTFDTFVKQTEIACKAGASGVIVGRAVWAEAVELTGEARKSFVNSIATERMRALSAICRDYARPWYHSVQAPETDLDWFMT